MADVNNNGINDDLEGVIAAMLGIGVVDPGAAETYRETARLYRGTPAYSLFTNASATPVDNKKDTKKSGGSTTYTQTQSTQFSAQQLQAAATDAAQRAIGRALTKRELARMTKHINQLEKENPTVTTTTARGSSTTSRTRGGVDEAGAMQSWAEQNPEYAGYQTATTYFDAMLGALRGPAGGSI